MRLRNLRFGLVALFVLLLAVPAFAGETASPLIDPVEFTFGGYFFAVDTSVRADEVDGERGTDVDFEKDLDFASNDQIFRLGGSWVFKKRHQLNFTYYDFKRSSSTVLQREIQWRGRTFTINSEVGGFFNTEVIEFSYTYWLKASEKRAFGLNGGIQYLGLDIGASIRGAQIGGRSSDLPVDAPVPLVGLEYRRAMGEKFLFRGIARAVYVSGLEELKKAHVIDGTLAFEHQTFRNGGIGLAYRILDFRVEVERRFVAGDVGYRIDGAELYLRASF
jgi:hypothetical protein